MHIERCLLILFLRSLPIFCDIAIDFTVVDPACDRLIPTFNTNQIMPFGSSRFRIRTFDFNGTETFEYSDRPLLVRVEGDHYTRGQIHARALLFPDRQVGIFQEPLPKYFKLANCSGKSATAVINDNYVTRRHGSVIWKPPDIPKGPILFYASPIKEDTKATNKSLYPIRSHFISPALGKPDVDSRNCGRSHGCLSVGEDDCLFGKTCDLSVKWICYQNRILIEALQYDKLVSFGFAEDAEHAVMCVATNKSVKVEDYILPRSPRFVAYRKDSRSPQYKLLKGSLKRNRVYCRYEMPRKQAGTLFVYGGVDVQYGTPEKYNFERLQTRDLCEPRNFHAASKRKKKAFLNASLLTGGSCTINAHSIFVICFFYALLQ